MPEDVTLALGAAGHCPAVEWGGRVWRIGHPTQKYKAALEQACAAAALDDARGLADVLGGAAGRGLVADVKAQVRRRHFATGAAGWRAALAGPRADALVLYALVAPLYPDAFTLGMAGRMATEARDAVEAALALVFPPPDDDQDGVGEGNADSSGMVHRALRAALADPLGGVRPAAIPALADCTDYQLAQLFGRKPDDPVPEVRGEADEIPAHTAPLTFAAYCALPEYVTLGYGEALLRLSYAGYVAETRRRAAGSPG